MRLLMICCQVFIHTALVFAQPQLEIVKPEVMAVGSILIFEAKSEDAKHYKWILLHDKKITDNPSYREVDGGKSCITVSKAGDYILVCSAANETGITTQTVIYTLGDSPEPEPDGVPLGKYSLTKLSYDEGMKILSTDRFLTARSIANSMKVTVLEIEKDKTLEPIAIMEKFRKSNTTSLNQTTKETWKAWMIAINDRLDYLAKNDVIKTRDHYIEAMKAIYQGLEYINE